MQAWVSVGIPPDPSEKPKHKRQHQVNDVGHVTKVIILMPKIHIGKMDKKGHGKQVSKIKE
jgi:hypothetical protein